jgi:C4-dicarboxylate-specific signal transduction histidine kinase
LLQEDPAQYRKTLEQQLEGARKAAARLNALRRFLRHDGTACPPATQLGDAVRDTIHLLAYPLRKAEVTIEEDVDGDVKIALAHPRLLQVLASVMLTVVRRPSPEGTRLRLSGRTDGPDVFVTMALETDTTMAILPPAGPPHWDVPTTGLELPLARRILAQVGGSIEVGAGEDAGFVLRLPLAIGTEGEQGAARPSTWAADADADADARIRQPKEWRTTPHVWASHR